MRLLNANTLVINNYFGDIPPYAILSHVWGDEEVSFQDFQSGQAAGLKGYSKIQGCCKQAITDSLEHVWIDTCCIDKSSSSELQEAINSMFNFYRNAAVCYAYLQDVTGDADTFSLNSSFSKSRWFTRGWTLQELLAPSLVEFYASDWKPLGTRDDLKKTIAVVTRIDQEFFAFGKFSDYSIAQKFSWASGRQTTRVEDEAYCLLGLFGVSMPLLYGEGRRAFMRLQEELMKGSDDQSIFAWTSTIYNDNARSGLFASSPAAFEKSGSIIRGERDFWSPPYSITNKGVSIHLPLIEPDSGYAIPFIPSHSQNFNKSGDITFSLTPAGTLAVLNCRSKQNSDSQMAIVIERAGTGEANRWTRTSRSLGLISISQADIRSHATQKNLFIQAHTVDGEGIGWTTEKRGQLIIIQGLSLSAASFQLKTTKAGPKCHVLSNGAMTFRIPPAASGTGNQQIRLRFEGPHDSSFAILITISDAPSHKTLLAELRATRATQISSSSPYDYRDNEGAEAKDEDAVRLYAERLPHAVRIRFPQWYFSGERFEDGMKGRLGGYPPPIILHK
ncbi:HET-domain-containing protein [Acephala macrosclerotiorum]|nr:HET-domain-containing protein [Acephala macrosclerotiorum]